MDRLGKKINFKKSKLPSKQKLAGQYVILEPLNILKHSDDLFTNISQDHYDYHKNYKKYFNSKMRLFLNILRRGGVAIINSDSTECKKILNLCKKKKIKTFTYGYNSKDLRLVTYYEDKKSQKIIINYKNKILRYELPLVGDFQVYNSLCAICIVLFSGFRMNKILPAVKNISQIHYHKGDYSLGELGLSVQIRNDNGEKYV